MSGADDTLNGNDEDPRLNCLSNKGKYSVSDDLDRLSDLLDNC